MSTKIYNGYITKTNISDLLLKFQGLVSAFEKIQIEGYSKYLIASSVRDIDFKIMSGEQVNQRDILFEQYNKHCDKVNETIKRGLRYSDLDFSASVSVLFLKRNTTLLLFYSENDEMTKLWDELDFVQEYHYQNQTDKPDNISERCWDKRRKDWDKVLGDDAPIKRGYTFTFTGERLPWVSLVDIEKNIPNLEQRANDYLGNHWISNKIVAIKAENNIEGSDSSVYFKAVDNWKAFKKTDEYKVSCDDIIKKLPVIDFLSSKKEKLETL